MCARLGLLSLYVYVCVSVRVRVCGGWSVCGVCFVNVIFCVCGVLGLVCVFSPALVCVWFGVRVVCAVCGVWCARSPVLCVCGLVCVVWFGCETCVVWYASSNLPLSVCVCVCVWFGMRALTCSSVCVSVCSV